MVISFSTLTGDICGPLELDQRPASYLRRIGMRAVGRCGARLDVRVACVRYRRRDAKITRGKTPVSRWMAQSSTTSAWHREALDHDILA